MDARGGRPSSHYGWTRAALKAFPDDATPQLLAAMRSERLVAVAPLVRQRLHGVHRSFLAGASQLGEPVDLAWRDETALRRLAAAIARSGTPLVLPRVPADSRAVTALTRTCRGRAIVVLRPAPSCPFIVLDDSWIEPERHLSAQDRSDLCRARHKAESHGPLAIKIHAPTLHDLPRLLDIVLEVESGRPESMPTGSGLSRTVFFRQHAEAACVDGTLRVCLLHIGDRVAATQVAVESGRAFWLLKAGTDDRFAACLPGELLLRETLRYAAEAALRGYEFWGGSRAGPWATGERPCVSLRTYPLNPRGLAALVADAAMAGWRKWRS